MDAVSNNGIDPKLVSENELGPRQPKHSKSLSKFPLLLAGGFLCLIIGLILYGINAESEADPSAEEVAAKQSEQEKKEAEKKSSVDLSIKGFNSKHGAVQEDSFEKALASDKYGLDINSGSEIKDPRDDKIAELEKKLLELEKNRLLVQQQNITETTNKIDAEIKERERLKREIASQKRQLFMQALVAPSKTNFDANSVKGGNTEDLTTNAGASAAAQRAYNNAGASQVYGPSAPSVMGGGPGGGGPQGMTAEQQYAQYEREGSWDLSKSIEAPHNDFTVRAGWVLPATLISGVTSDTAGQILGQVSQNVYDTATGKHLLIPQGTRLVGTYASGASYGQSRIMIAWQRLIYPDNKTLDLGSMPGTDISGFSGFSDEVDNHWFSLIANALLMSGITATVSMATADDSNSNSDSTSMSNEARVALANQFGSVVAQVIQRNLNVSPTITIRPGYRFNVMVTKDLKFGKAYTPFDYKTGNL